MYFIVTHLPLVSVTVSAARSADSQKYDTAKLDCKKQNEKRKDMRNRKFNRYIPFVFISRLTANDEFSMRIMHKFPIAFKIIIRYSRIECIYYVFCTNKAV